MGWEQRSRRGQKTGKGGRQKNKIQPPTSSSYIQSINKYYKFSKYVIIYENLQWYTTEVLNVLNLTEDFCAVPVTTVCVHTGNTRHWY